MCPERHGQCWGLWPPWPVPDPSSRPPRPLPPDAHEPRGGCEQRAALQGTGALPGSATHTVTKSSGPARAELLGGPGRLALSYRTGRPDPAWQAATERAGPLPKGGRQVPRGPRTAATETTRTRWAPGTEPSAPLVAVTLWALTLPGPLVSPAPGHTTPRPHPADRLWLHTARLLPRCVRQAGVHRLGSPREQGGDTAGRRTTEGRSNMQTGGGAGLCLW